MDTETKTMINLTIDGTPIKVPKGTTVYKACRQLGIDIPIFCYQDRMPPFGACRVCLVEVEKMPKLQTSCTLEVTEGMVVHTQKDTAVKGRQEILEFLLINHPLDCPICDRGGECPLQDQVVKFGPGLSRFYEDKRRFVKPVPLGPVLMLDRERCIVCARCTRFGDVVAGDHALEFIDRGYKTEVGTPDGGPVESKFIGNTIMICPVGALTSRVYRFRARPWDNFSVESTCTLCPVGCSMIFDSRDGEIMRTRSRENKDINDIWLCDKGWFGYEFTNSQERLQTPLIRRTGNLEPASWDEALDLIASKIKEYKPAGKLAAMGGNPLTTEENFLFQKLMRDVVGVQHIDHRIGMPITSCENECSFEGMELPIGECGEVSYAFLLGIDLTEEFPVIWLRLKEAINKGAKVIFIGNYAPEVASHLENTILHAPGKEVEILKQHLSHFNHLAKEGKKGTVFVGHQYLASVNRSAILAEVINFRNSTPNMSLNIMEGKGNSCGARIAGMRPDCKPFGQSIEKSGLNAIQVLENSCIGNWDFLYVAGANPATKYPSALWDVARAGLDFLVVQDLFLTETALQADVVLPTLSYVEKTGSFVNIEGRIQQINPGKAIPEDILSDGEIFIKVAEKLDATISVDDDFLENVKAHTKNKVFNLKPILSFLNVPEGSLCAVFAPVLFDHGERMLRNTRLVQMAKAPKIRMNIQEGIRRGLRDGKIVTVSANGQSVSGELRLDASIAEGTVVLPLGFKELPVHKLAANLLNGIVVQVE